MSGSRCGARGRGCQLQQQVGHSWASTTAIYTSVGGDAKNRMLADALARVFDGDDHDGGGRR